MRRTISVLSAWSAVLLIGARAQDVPNCVPGCANQVRSEFTQFSCNNADDASCLCPSADFSNGIRDCSSAGCGATDADVATYLSSSFCLTAETSSTTSTTTEATSTTAAATTEAVTSTTSTSSTPEPTVAATSSSSTTPTTMSTSTTSSESTSSASASNTPAAGDQDEDDEEDDDDDDDGGLTGPATIGVAVGAATGGLILIGIGICVYLAKRPKKPKQRPQRRDISKPIPASAPPSRGGGNNGAFVTRDPAFYEKFDTDIEMTSNKYDDMPLRQEPRTMV